MPASLGIKLEQRGWQGVETRLVGGCGRRRLVALLPADMVDGGAPPTWACSILSPTITSTTPVQVGLQQVIAALWLGAWLRLAAQEHRPRVSAYQPADARFCGAGQGARRPGSGGGACGILTDVGAAIRRGVDYVLADAGSYILDMRTAQAPHADANARGDHHAGADTLPGAAAARYVPSPDGQIVAGGSWRSAECPGHFLIEHLSHIQTLIV